MRMININIHTQPDDESCGPTSLHAIYHYYGHEIDLSQIVQTTERSISGGTLAPMLGKHALQEGFQATVYINNVNIFDPSWFDSQQGDACQQTLMQKLGMQLEYKEEPGIIQVSQAYISFLQAGGRVRFRTLTVQLLKEYFDRKIPILTGLSATYLYNSPRERFENGHSIYDDIHGVPCGHFVILCGYDDKKKLVVVADPHRANPISQDNYYKVSSHRLINAILLGVLTYDGNLLIIEPKEP